MRHRSARGRRRFHTERVFSNRQRRYARITPVWAQRHRLEDGRLANADRYYDCGRARCGVCHWEKFYEPRRVREGREWRWLEESAW